MIIIATLLMAKAQQGELRKAVKERRRRRRKHANTEKKDKERVIEREREREREREKVTCRVVSRAR